MKSKTSAPPSASHDRRTVGTKHKGGWEKHNLKKPEGQQSATSLGVSSLKTVGNIPLVAVVQYVFGEETRPDIS